MKISPRTIKRLEVLDRRGLRVITIGALVVGVVSLIFVAVRTFFILTAHTLTVAGLPIENSSSPELADGVSPISSATYDSVTLAIDAPPTVVRWIIVSETALSALLTIGLSVIVYFLGTRLLKQRPFARSATWATLAAAILVIAVGMFTPLIQAILNAELVKFLGDGVLATNGTGEGLVIFEIILDFSPLAWGLALGMVAGAFEFGQRLQRDTDGLV
ncbi:hypothetical protein CLV85_0600 [Salinibacterium amurskyense]|uniref:DUF2975 domain-containing protein n=1 Tax=Salinibacterium amurskyense TaxID=205941 RepID=A0A2M9D6T0_9MICO|nr:hypothetical protein [Salinibacterium amurskyense]PJJ81424.1 hypothetical protein CLV85_0600 [Salinibacterium amurskyense]RLQ83418.1 hypothetical protein D9C83_02955 [Salinibacterium amurskyense]GHD80545.1 hypothetical protein GCM10007394_12130 [Salinibacterium amurskyense]